VNRRTAVGAGTLLLLLGLGVVWGLRRQEPQARPVQLDARAARHAAVTVLIRAGGRALPGIAVALLDPADRSHAEASGTTDHAGRCVLRAALGDYLLSVQHPEFVTHERTLPIRDGLTVEVELERGGTLQGVISDDEGPLRIAAAVRAVDPTSAREIRTVRSDASGQYVLRGLPLRSLRLHVTSARHVPKDTEAVVFRRHGEARRFDVRLERGQTITGRVLGPAGEPIAGAYVGSSGEGSEVVKTNVDGEFELAGLADEPRSLFATASGFARSLKRNVAPGARGVELVLSPPATLRGQIRLDPAARETRIDVCHIDAALRKELCVASALVAPRGSFEVRNVPEGEYDVVVVSDGTEQLRVPAVLSAGQVTELPLLEP
jgi:hypothetical protein